MRFETHVAFRYLRGKRKNRFVSLITVISIAGVSVGVITLIVVMSVMTGFDMALREAVIGNRAHLTIHESGGAAIGAPDEMARQIEAIAPEIVASAPVSQITVILGKKTGGEMAFSGALLVGIDNEREQKVTRLAENLTAKDGRTLGEGRLPDDLEIVLGCGLAREAGADVGDYVQVLAPRQVVSPLGFKPRPVWLEVTGISQARMSDFDRYYAFISLATAERLAGARGVQAIHCKLTDAFLADAVAGRIERQLGLRAITWYESQEGLFASVKQSRFALFVILVFIILVAAFNITSTLIMVVMEKRRDIGILRTVGVSTPSVLLLFVIEGLFIGLTGTALGVVLGALLAHNLNPVAGFVARLAGIELFNSQIYYFDYIPAAVMPLDVLRVAAAAVLLTLVSTLYPAWSAARLAPIDALRSE